MSAGAFVAWSPNVGMSEADRELTQLIGDLAGAIDELQSELEPSRGPLRPPTPRELARFTSEVTIPAIILALETNVRALRLVQRALRLADGRETNQSSSVTRDRATALGRATVDRLDDALTDLQGALDGRPPDDDARELLGRAQDLQADIKTELDGDSTATIEPSDGAPETDSADTPTHVEVDVDAELDALKDDLDDSAHDGNDDTD